MTGREGGGGAQLLEQRLADSIETESVSEHEEEEGSSGSTLSPTAVSRNLKRMSMNLRLLRTDLEEETEEGEPLLSPQAKLPPPRTLQTVWEERIGDVLLITKLAARLYGHLWSGFRWWVNFWRLLAFTTLLLPGFAQMILFYFFSPRVIRSVPFGTQPRNRLDVFLPRRRWASAGPRPVIVYISGGAWIIGYKAWGALLGRRLSQRGVLVFALDYRNYPQGTCEDMLQDVNTGIKWVLENAHLYGGSTEAVHLVGQSAGGQLGALALLAQVQQAGEGRSAVGATPAWDPARIRGFCGVSGAYNLESLAGHLHRRGLYHELYNSIHSVDGRPAITQLSPTHAARRLPAELAAQLPPILILHGTADKSVPMEIAIEFVGALAESGAKAHLKLYKAKTHTQPIVEDPMKGGRDELMDDVLGMVTGQQCHNCQFPMLPAAFIDLASWVCPF